jgi:hypothetical protein
MYRYVITFGLGCCLLTAVSRADAPAEPTAQDFATAKAQHVARLQQELACVQAATTEAALQACRPPHPGGHMGPPPAR